MEWCVVVFSDNTVDVVPKKWIVENQTYFPARIDQKAFGRMLQDCVPYEDTWELFEIRILGFYDSLSKAKKKAQQALETDNICSSETEDDSAKRKIKQNKRYLQSPERRSASPPSPPALSVDYVPLLKKNRSIIGSSQNLSKNFQSPSPTRSRNNEVLESINKLNTSLASTLTAQSSIASPSTSSVSAISESSKFGENLAQLQVRTEEFQRELLRQIFSIMDTLRHHSDYFKEILGNKNEVNVELNVLNEIMELLPIKNHENLEKVENFLSADITNFNIFTKEMSRVGGDTVDRITKRILYKLLSNEMATLYSWEGAKGKIVFKKLNLARVVIHAARICPHLKNDNDDLVISRIKLWLARAKDRLQTKAKQ